MINDRLVWFLENNNLLSNIQCGFRQNRNAIDHLIRLDSYIHDAFARKEHVVTVFFDLYYKICINLVFEVIFPYLFNIS
ncbi:hypothetical protein BOW30_12850 [Solemya velum gill symbiont]|nr:hypothetical protein BOW30_12850 [Solemya velum gill symbiont]